MTTQTTTYDFDTMTDRQARKELKRLYEAHPDVVEAVWSATEIASPLAGPVRILREVVAALA